MSDDNFHVSLAVQQCTHVYLKLFIMIIVKISTGFLFFVL